MRKLRFVDCGANVGQSIEWALKTFENYDLKIDSFEPLPKNYALLSEKFSSTQKVTLHNVAVSNQDSTQVFYCQNWGARTGSSLIKGKSSTSESDAIVVKTIDLALWLKSNIASDEEVILKIDVEGEEYNLLPHLLQHSIEKLSEVWLIEFHGTKTPNFNSEVEGIVRKNVKHVLDWSRPDQVLIEFERLGLFK